MNKVILFGRLVDTPTLKKTQTGKSVCNIRLAMYKNPDEADFVSITCWEKTADRVANCQKGDKLLVEGSISTQSYQDDKLGKKVYQTVVTAYRIEYGGKAESNQQKPQNAYQQKPARKPDPVESYEDFSGLEIDPDDLPF